MPAFFGSAREIVGTKASLLEISALVILFEDWDIFSNRIMPRLVNNIVMRNATEFFGLSNLLA